MARKIIEYESPDYGIFLIQQESNNRWIIGWDPEQCCEYHGLDQYQHNFDFLLGCCLSNPKNLTSKSFEDLPKNGEFSSEENAKKYLENKFGTLN